ncbi:MAG: transketolase C-terminal domain-containing protein, partial [Marinilabiliaceae bacterium]
LMMKQMPDRAFDVGIAEQHAVTFSAGMAVSGLVPFCNIYSSFMQRAYDQVIHDVALQRLNVVFCLDRGGLVGADGPTHHGAYDLAYFRCIPNMIISSPMDEPELRNLMYTAQLPDMGPFVIRYPRGNGSRIDWQTPFEKIEVGTGRRLASGHDLAFLTLGPVGVKVQRIVEELKEENISAGHYDMRFVKPLDESMLHEVFDQYSRVITIEEGTIVGGMGSAVLEFMSEHGYQATVKRLGIPDQFIDQGTQTELTRDCGFDMDSIRQAARRMSERKGE